MVGGIFPRFSLKFGNVLRYFGRNIGPCGVMQYRVIHEFTQIKDVEGHQIRHGGWWWRITSIHGMSR
jgi:hypothetical protein